MATQPHGAHARVYGDVASLVDHKYPLSKIIAALPHHPSTVVIEVYDTIKLEQFDIDSAFGASSTFGWAA